MKNKVEVESYDNSNEVGWAIIGVLKHNSKIKDTLIQLVVENTYKVFEKEEVILTDIPVDDIRDDGRFVYNGNRWTFDREKKELSVKTIAPGILKRVDAPRSGKIEFHLDLFDKCKNLFEKDKDGIIKLSYFQLSKDTGYSYMWGEGEIGKTHYLAECTEGERNRIGTKITNDMKKLYHPNLFVERISGENRESFTICEWVYWPYQDALNVSTEEYVKAILELHPNLKDEVDKRIAINNRLKWINDNKEEVEDKYKELQDKINEIIIKNRHIINYKMSEHFNQDNINDVYNLDGEMGLDCGWVNWSVNSAQSLEGHNHLKTINDYNLMKSPNYISGINRMNVHLSVGNEGVLDRRFVQSVTIQKAEAAIIRPLLEDELGLTLSVHSVLD